jgi:hypothetical protein
MNQPPYPPRPGATPYPGNQFGPPGYAPPEAMYPPASYALVSPKPFSTNAIISMVLGGVGILMMPLGLLTGPIGAILGWLGMKESREPEGTHRGRGLAIGGLIVSLVAFVLSVLLIIVYIFFFQFFFSVMESERARSERQQTVDQAEEDMRAIEERLREYFIDNGRSLGPGGMVLSDRIGEEFLPLEERDVVEDELRIEHLISNYDLNNSLDDYELVIEAESKARLYCRSVGRVMRIDYSQSRRTSIETISDEP